MGSDFLSFIYPEDGDNMFFQNCSITTQRMTT